MGAPSDNIRTEDSIRLLTYGYRFFETHKLYNAGNALTRARVWKGQNKETQLGLSEDLIVTMPVGQYKNIQAAIQLNDVIKAPIKKGQQYGTLNILLKDQLLASKPLIALSDNLKGAMWRNIADSVSFGFHKLFSKSTEKANNG